MYESNTLGPACAMTFPEPKNSPEPIAPPSESITMWRVFKEDFKPVEFSIKFLFSNV
jgi:hypothetical protein